MPNFCTKCGKASKPGIKFCTSCGGSIKVKTVAPPPRPVAPPPPPPPPPRRGGSGCGTGCAVGCLIMVLMTILLLALVIGGGYYLISKFKGAEPGDYFEVDNKNSKICERMEDTADLGEFAVAEFEVLGANGSDCVIFVKIVDIKELPEGMNLIPDFVLNIILKDLSIECLVPQTIYKKGIESAGEYIGKNLTEACKGPLFDMAEKYDIDLEN